MDRIARIDKQVFTGGLFLDQEQQTAPLWTEGSNVLFRAGEVGVFPGSVPLFTRTRTGVITGLGELSSIVTGENALVYGFRDQLLVWDVSNGVTSVGSGYTGYADQGPDYAATRWSLQQWNEWVVATNGQDPMQLLKTVGSGFADMTTSTSTQFKKAEVIRKFRQFLVAFNLELSDGTKQPNAAAWCDVNDVETWVPTASNSARKIFIPDMDSGILCAEKFGDNIFMYSGDQAYALTYSGYPNVFQPQPLVKGIGVYGKNCVCEAKGFHYGLGPRGFWRTDGVTYDYLDTPAVKKYLARTLNRDQASKVVVYHDRTIDHILIFYPQIGQTENGAVLALNYLENKWTKGAFSRTAAIDSGIFDYGITGDTVGNVYRQSLQDVPVSDAVQSQVQVKSSGVIKLGYGRGGYGQYGYGGKIYV